MAEKTEFLQAIDEAILDADSLEKFINGSDSETVLTRLSAKYPTLQKALKELFENGGIAGRFKTLTSLQASSLPNDSYAFVADDADDKNGIYIKEGGSWVKSKYDLLLKSHLDNLNLVVNVSKVVDNYNLTLSEAIPLVPNHYKKNGVIIEINREDRYVFKGLYTPENFLNIRYWLKVSDISMSSELNLFKEHMVNYGFYFDNSKGVNGVTYNENSATAIVPIHRFYDEGGAVKNAKVFSEKKEILTTNRAGFLDKNLNVVVGYDQPKSIMFLDRPIPTSARYIFINIADGVRSNLPNIEYYYYPRDGYENYSVKELNDNKPIIIDNKKEGLSELSNHLGEVFYKTDRDIFYNPETKAILGESAPRLYEVVTDIFFKTKDSGSIYTPTGRVRRVYIDALSKYATGITFRVAVESDEIEGQFDVGTCTVVSFNGGDLLSSTAAKYVYGGSSGVSVRATINPSTLKALGSSANTNLQTAQVKESYLLKRYWEMPELQATRFDDFDISKTRFISNYDWQPATGKLAETFVGNGKKTYELVGSSASNVHEQSALTSSKFIEVSGKKSVTVFCDVSADPTYKQPQPVPMRNPSAYKKHDSSIGQYIHPDVVCIPDGFLGYKYWMINSHYPYSIAPVEDAEIFVSNDGVNWDRILHPKETLPTTIPFRIPESYWDIYDPRNYDTRERLFMPIPRVSATMEFQTNAGIAQGKVKGYLAHDPAISYQNGWLNFYCTYNFDLDITSSRARYTVCYRTQDFVNWEVVRENGTSFAYNKTSAQKIFSSTGGVRNHIAYFEDSAETNASKQFVRVSDNLWYCYAVRSEGGGVTKLVRYQGTNPYQFDWSDRTTCTTTPAFVNILWHICVEYIDGKFYLMNGNQLSESSDGVTFTSHPNSFIETGMQAEAYKPYFVKGHDGKMKVGVSLGVRTETIEPFIGTQSNSSNIFSRTRYISHTICCEYPSLQHIINASKGLRNDAFVDVVLQIHREQTGEFEVHLMPKLKGKTTLNNVTFRKGDYVRVISYLNTIAQGTAIFEGVLIDDRT